MNVGLSVSRVGSAAQTGIMKKVAGSMKGELAQYRELAAFAKFGSDLDPATKKTLDRGARLTELLKQPQFSPLRLEQQAMVIYAGTRGYLDKVPVGDVTRYEKELLAWLESNKADLLKKIRDEKKLTDEINDAMAAALTEFGKVFG